MFSRWIIFYNIVTRDLGSHCLPVCKNRFEKFARVFIRRHKQTAFSDAGFLGALRVNSLQYLSILLNVGAATNCCTGGKQCRS